MLSDGVCACNRQERTHTLRGFGDSGAGRGWRRTRQVFLLGAADRSLDRISDEIGVMGQGSQRPDLDVQVTRTSGTAAVMPVMGLVAPVTYQHLVLWKVWGWSWRWSSFSPAPLVSLTPS